MTYYMLGADRGPMSDRQGNKAWVQHSHVGGLGDGFEQEWVGANTVSVSLCIHSTNASGSLKQTGSNAESPR